MTDSTTHAKRELFRNAAVYTLFRLALVAVIAAIFYGLGRIFVEDLPLVLVFLLAIIVALPLSMVVGKGLRQKVAESAAVIDDARKERRNQFRRRLQGMDE